MSKAVWWVLVGYALTGQARAGMVEVGKITVDRNEEGSGRFTVGANFIAHFTLSKDFAKQDCCKESDLHWLQYVTLSSPVFFGATRTPDRPFIDPRNGQRAPGTPTGFGDDLPFYDLTYATLDDAKGGKPEKDKVDGTGPYLRDDPRIQVNDGDRPFTFAAKSLLVCVHDDKTLAILGGVNWGFTLDKNNKVTIDTPKEIQDGRLLDRNVNDALRQDFNGWMVLSADQLCKDSTPVVRLQAVPEPSAVVLFGSGLGMIAASVCRRQRASEAHRGRRRARRQVWWEGQAQEGR